MATRNEKLNRLRIASPCTASWDGMAGDTVRRHCAHCDRQVFDFAHMTPRQIEARVEASGGRLCARITRGSDGRLVTLPAPEPPLSWTKRRASPVAAALVTALLALRGAAAESASAAAEEASAAPEPDRPDSGRVQPETLPRLAEVTMPLNLDEITVGELVVPFEEPLRQVFGESDLVVTGVVGATAGIDPEEPSEVEIEIRVTSVLKGRHAGRSLFVDHAEDEENGRLAPGTKVLAFLKAGDARPGRKVVYGTTGWEHGLEALSDDELAAYADRLDALERISRRGDPQPEELAEWLVATAEEPLTREEVKKDLASALSSLDALAEEKNLSSEQAAADVRAEVAMRLADGEAFKGGEALGVAGAFVTEAEKHRLTRALLATRGITAGDLGLYEIVRRWAADEANEWLSREFKQAEPIDDGVGRDAMGRLAEMLESDSLTALLDEADAKGEALFASIPEEDWDEASKRINADFSGLQKELRSRFREMLGE